MVGEDGGVDGLNDMYHENKLLSKETQNLRTRIKAMQVAATLICRLLFYFVKYIVVTQRIGGVNLIRE